MIAHMILDVGKFMIVFVCFLFAFTTCFRTLLAEIKEVLDAMAPFER